MDQEKYGFVYIWRDRKHNRYYIGAHWGREDDGYICSSIWMIRAYKIRPQDFKKPDGTPNRRILQRIYTSKKDTFIAEDKYLKQIKEEELGKKYYNLINFSACYWTGKPVNEENKSKKLKEMWADPQFKEKFREKQKEIQNRPEMRKRKSDRMKEKWKEAEYRRTTIENSRKAINTLEVKAKKSKSIKEAKNRPENKEIVSKKSKEMWKNPEYRRKVTKIRKEMWADPQFKEKMKLRDRGHLLKKYKCEFCDYMGNLGSLSRYHNKNCKLNV